MVCTWILVAESRLHEAELSSDRADSRWLPLNSTVQAVEKPRYLNRVEIFRAESRLK